LARQSLTAIRYCAAGLSFRPGVFSLGLAGGIAAPPAAEIGVALVSGVYDGLCISLARPSLAIV